MRCWLSCKGNPDLWINCFLIKKAGYCRLSRNLSVYSWWSSSFWDHEGLGLKQKNSQQPSPESWNGNVQHDFWTLKLTSVKFIGTLLPNQKTHGVCCFFSRLGLRGPPKTSPLGLINPAEPWWHRTQSSWWRCHPGWGWWLEGIQLAPGWLVGWLVGWMVGWFGWKKTLFPKKTQLNVKLHHSNLGIGVENSKKYIFGFHDPKGKMERLTMYQKMDLREIRRKKGQLWGTRKQLLGYSPKVTHMFPLMFGGCGG